MQERRASVQDLLTEISLAIGRISGRIRPHHPSLPEPLFFTREASELCGLKSTMSCYRSSKKKSWCCHHYSGCKCLPRPHPKVAELWVTVLLNDYLSKLTALENKAEISLTLTAIASAEVLIPAHLTGRDYFLARKEQSQQQSS